ncbi:hypothetical protein [Streptomyces sp. BK340]|uniref:hypothetical protein n=1 Tax=Streptomyces sp. BK340 TaxID=2572903 RepID=UPI0011A20922|nr:hypothetical protein [Streptomyces sp. BK340]TVZ96465.1 hypothetical protein FB157_103376 [Streptomyces sp. BK340]
MTRETILRLPAPLRICAQLVWPTGQHRPHGSVVGQRFTYCPGCGGLTAHTVHGPLLRCAEGHEQPAGGTS